MNINGGCFEGAGEDVILSRDPSSDGDKGTSVSTSVSILQKIKAKS